MRKDVNDAVFVKLFQEVCLKGLGHPLAVPLSETDSKALSAAILEQTGLVVGIKSIKNYSFYVLDAAETKKENPSTATLDTLARYVLDAPHTDEVRRKTHESHYPYWYQYRNSQLKGKLAEITAPRTGLAVPARVMLITAVVIAGLLLWKGRRLLPSSNKDKYAAAFNTTSMDSLLHDMWTIDHVDSAFWGKRSILAGHLTLYTLPGDNWPDSTHNGTIRNLMIRDVSADCFSAEIHFTNFFPAHNWQQAGLLLSENSSFTGKVVRLSFSYNDFFGGYDQAPEILIQGISSSETGSHSKPEEFAHVPLFTLRQAGDSIVSKNLRKSALKIEKQGRHFRFLYTAGSMDNFAFREAIARDFSIQPRYIALFAIQGHAPASNIMPVHVDSFSLVHIPCGE